jgi:hypothetical protein
MIHGNLLTLGLQRQWEAKIFLQGVDTSCINARSAAKCTLLPGATRPARISAVLLNGGHGNMRYNSSCLATEIWENLCIGGVKKGFIVLTHDGKADDNSGHYTRIYAVRLKATIHPAFVKFVYDKRDGKDRAYVKVSLDDLVLILRAIENQEFSFDAPGLNISMNKDDGFEITQR